MLETLQNLQLQILLHVPIVTLCTKYSTNLAKQLNEGFKRSVYWNSYETKPAKVIEQGKNIYELLNASFQGVKRLFVLAYFVAAPAALGGNTDDTAGIKNNFLFSNSVFSPKWRD